MRHKAGTLRYDWHSYMAGGKSKNLIRVRFQRLHTGISKTHNKVYLPTMQAGDTAVCYDCGVRLHGKQSVLLLIITAADLSFMLLLGIFMVNSCVLFGHSYSFCLRIVT